MIRQQAFIGKNKMLKGNLHVHTTRSDGLLKPEDCMKVYKEKGYDFLAITDHRVYNMKNFAPELGLTIIPGMEFDTRLESADDFPHNNGMRYYHTVCIGPSKEDGNGFNHDDNPDTAVTPDSDSYQPYLDDIHSKNNLTIYCHPEWSATPPRLFETQKGNIAMEIRNSGNVENHDMDVDALYWDEILGKGLKLWGVAADDAHGQQHMGLSYVMVNAENNINAILEALKEGKFYSSCGPEIYDFYVDGEFVYIDCSKVAKIRLHSDQHPTRIIRSADGDLTHGEFNLKDWVGYYDYVRMSVVDKDGNIAWTNPIFLK